MTKLTKRTVEALKIKTKDYFVWDSQIAGFGLRVMPSGAKTLSGPISQRWAYPARFPWGGMARITAEQARKLAQEVMGSVAKGDNPAEDLSLHRRAPTVAALCERLFEQHVMQNCKPSTQGEYRRAIELFIKPTIGSFKTVDVERKDIADPTPKAPR